MGTTFSVVGYSKDNQVIIVQDKEGHKIFPSIVSYLDSGGNDSITVGIYIYVCMQYSIKLDYIQII